MDIDGDIILRDMKKADCEQMEEAFSQEVYGVTTQLYTSYYKASCENECDVIVACKDDKIVGYGIIAWHSNYEAFEEDIPEIKAVHVLNAYKNKGIATKLMDVLEERATQYGEYCSVGVGLAEAYEAAQRLCSKRGYEPDGKGIYYIEQIYDQLEVDDNQALMMIKRLCV